MQRSARKEIKMACYVLVSNQSKDWTKLVERDTFFKLDDL